MTFTRPLSYDQTTDGHGRRVAQFTCVECGEKTNVTNLRGMPPDQVVRKAEQAGWAAHPHKRTDVYCPKCAGPQKKPNFTKGTTMAVTPIKPAVEVRQPTPDQRVKIRNHLDKSFDDAAGVYLDGMSDQKIAEMVDVPRVIVEQLREAAWGPIKVDPVIVGLRAELAEMRRLSRTCQDTLDRLTAKADDVQRRIEAHASGKAA